jgi:thymidylate synthase ThyX
MAYNVRVLKDSIAFGKRLTTLEVTLPRIVLAEFNTHRMFSRNSASSRAIPVEKMLQRVKEDPFIPIYWGKNQKGMQAEQELTFEEQASAEREWLLARDSTVTHAQAMLNLGIHKQITNRLLEPFLWHTIIVTATEWDNFFGLRLHPDAQPEIRRAALLMKEAMNASVPTSLSSNEWHLPLVDDHQELVEAGFSTDEICLISIGRCARVSYLTHDGKRDPKADITLAKRLQSSGHFSPFEHAARPAPVRDDGNTWYGNFSGWQQYRKTVVNEHDFSKMSSVSA